MEIVLCSSFSPLTIDYDYFGLSTFDPIVDRCVFFNNGIDKGTVDLINNQFTVPIKWTDYVFINFSHMRNDLIAAARKETKDASWILMIDDTYLINCPFSKEQIKYLIDGYEAATFFHKTLGQPTIKLFRSDSFYYILRHNELIKYKGEGEIQGPSIVDLDIELLDLPDVPKSVARARRQIAFLKQDLLEWSHDLFIRTHIIYYLGIANELLNNKSLAMSYYKSIIDSGKIQDGFFLPDVPRDSWFYKQSSKKYKSYRNH